MSNSTGLVVVVLVVNVVLTVDVPMVVVPAVEDVPMVDVGPVIVVPGVSCVDCTGRSDCFRLTSKEKHIRVTMTTEDSFNQTEERGNGQKKCVQ